MLHLGGDDKICNPTQCPSKIYLTNYLFRDIVQAIFILK